jgi:outer membrane lipoprotein-sorting protein
MTTMPTTGPRPRAAAVATTLLLALVGPVAAQQDPGTAALEEAAARYDAARGMCADFVQELDNPLLGESRTSRGRLCQLRPNFFRMDFSDPEGDRIVADGEHFYIFYPSMNPGQVIRTPLDPSRGGMDFFREFLAEPTSTYAVTLEGRETVTGRATVRLHLVPRRGGGIREARVWVDPVADVIRKVTVTETSGVERTVVLSAVTLEPDVTAADFTFDLPPGARIVDAPGRPGGTP